MASSALIALVLLGVGWLIYRSIAGLITDTASVTHTHIVIETLSETLSLLKDVQGSQRGFVITGQEKYLDSYRAALPLIDQDLEKLKLLTADNPAQLQRLNSLKGIVENRLDLARTIIDVRRSQGFAASQRLILTGEGKREMDRIRFGIAEMEAEERRLLKRRSEAAQSSSRLALGVSSSGLLIVVLMVFVMLLLIRRESWRRMEVEAGLETANLNLQDSLTTLERLTKEMTLIAMLAEMLQSCRTSAEAYAVIGRTLPQVFPNATAALSLINASQNLVETVLKVPEETITPQSLFSPDECWALRRGHIHLVQNADSEVPCPHLTRAAVGESKEKETLPGSMLCLPLAAHGQTLGVLSIAAQPAGAFSEADQRVAFAVAEHASLALANLRLQETLRLESIRDPLSGLFNRRYLEASFEREIARATRREHPLSVIMIDIDFFKRFNDNFGHEAGDLVLQKFGDFLKSQSRAEDIACRYGGEEFTLILPDASLEAARNRAEQLRIGAAQLSLEYRRQQLPGITISVGVAAFPTHGLAKEDLMRAADAALYRAKKEGRDRVLMAETPAQIED